MLEAAISWFGSEGMGFFSFLFFLYNRKAGEVGL